VVALLQQPAQLVPHTHAPPTHVVPSPQALPHMPQLVLSVCVFTQAKPQTVAPVGQPEAHAPVAVHVAVPPSGAGHGAQAAPPAPQLIAFSIL